MNNLKTDVNRIMDGIAEHKAAIDKLKEEANTLAAKTTSRVAKTLLDHSKHYSSKLCVFLPHQINTDEVKVLRDMGFSAELEEHGYYVRWESNNG